jgi:hypothetical protein
MKAVLAHELAAVRARPMLAARCPSGESTLFCMLDFITNLLNCAKLIVTHAACGAGRVK